jgi:hypothetical protein
MKTRRLLPCALFLGLLVLPVTAGAKGYPFNITVTGTVSETWSQSGLMQFAPCAPNVERSGQTTIAFATNRSRILIGGDRGFRGKLVAAVHVDRAGLEKRTPTRAASDCTQPTFADASGCGARDYNSPVQLPPDGPLYVAIHGDKSLYAGEGENCPYPPNPQDVTDLEFESPMALWKAKVAQPWRHWVFGGCTASGKANRPRKSWTVRFDDTITTPIGRDWQGQHTAAIDWAVKFERVGRVPRVPPCR